MNKSRSFERAAHYYDNTRLMPEPIEKYAIPAIQELVGSTAHLLEVGAGTGRISIPLLEHGMDLVGFDLSSAMLRRLKAKFPAARVAQADASQLPFATAQFDAVLTVHVLHLIPAWREVLREIKRVLVPGGVYLNMRTWDSVGTSAVDQIRGFWRGWMSEHGIDAGHPGVRTHADLLQELRAMGATLSEVEPARYTHQVHVRQELDHFTSRIYSETWDIPDDIFDSSMEALRNWIDHEFGDLDRELVDEVRVLIHVATF